MKKSITSGLSTLDAKEITGEYQGSAMLRRRLVELLVKKGEVAYKQRISDATYDQPHWALKQADGVGYERALNDIISLISE